MKQIIIDKMTEIISNPKYDDSFCLKDFEKYDKEYLKNYDGSFIWCLRPANTHIIKTDMSIFEDELENSEAARYLFMQGQSTLDYIPDSKEYVYLYHDGTGMFPDLIYVKYEDIVKWAKNKKEKLMKKYADILPKDLKVKINLNCGIGYMKEQLEYAKKIGDTSLLDCLARFRRCTKLSDDHKVVITKDYAARSFFFCEEVHGVQRLCGGIIYHGSKDEGYRTADAVQLSPSYGWQIHT